jgi:hypothetical protein
VSDSQGADNATPAPPKILTGYSHVIHHPGIFGFQEIKLKIEKTNHISNLDV